MRLRELVYLLGLKPNYKFYPYAIENHAFDGATIRYARWLAPKNPTLINLQQEVDELRNFLNSGDFAIDIGAHVGDSTIPIALACGANGLVVALEPNPVTFSVLGANAVLNPQSTNIFPMPFAASERECQMTFDYGDPWLSNGGDHSGVSRWRHGSAFPVPVHGARVNNIIENKFAGWISKLRYLKIDVEGHDFKVLKTLERLVVMQLPYVKMEVGRPTTYEDRKGLKNFFGNLGYELRLVVDRRRLYGPILDDATLFGEKTIDIFAIPPSRSTG